MMGKNMTTHDLCQELIRDKNFFKHSGGGVTLSGGEALMDASFTLELLRELRKEGISTGIDTCGYTLPMSLEKVVPYIDFFLWDIKHMDPHKHEELTGVSNKPILENLTFVSRLNVPLYIRIPLIPGYNDSKENIIAACEFIVKLQSVVEVDLLPVHHLGQARYESLNRIYPIAGLELLSKTTLKALKDLVESYGLKTCILN
jgi:pyruvate formate lyase activating enzyme